MMARLGDLYQITSGGTPSRKQLDYYQDGTIPWVKTGDLKEKYLRATDEKITEIGLKNSSARIYPKDTVLIAMYGATIGASSILKIEAATNQACAAFVKRDDVIPEYLYAFLESQQSRFIKDAVGGAQPNISAGYLKQIDMPLIPIEEQRRIAALLDRVSDLIAKRRAQLDKLDELVKARFVEMFGEPVSNPKHWEKEVFSKNVTLLNGRAFKQEELLDFGKYPVLRVGNFFSNRGWYYSDLELDDDKYCDNGDLLYAWSASFGARIWEGDKVIYHYHIWKVLIKDAYDKQFLCKLLDYVTQSLMADTHGIAMMHLTKNGMEKTPFIVPPLELQEKFSSFVQQIDKSKLTIQQSLDKLEVLKKALMQQYFG